MFLFQQSPMVSLMNTARTFSFFRGFLAMLAVMICCQTSQALAAGPEPRLLSVHRDWQAYVFEEKGQPVCYMASQPIKAQGDYTKRGEIFAIVTHRPGDNSRDVFSYVTGYTYKKGSKVSLRIGSNSYTLFTHGDTAWAEDEKTDHAITKAIKAGSQMTVVGTSSRGTRTTDTISLRGSTAAYNAISQSCGIRP